MMTDIINELIEMLFSNKGLIKMFNKDEYADAFHSYYDKYRSLFEKIDSGYNNSDNKQEYLNEIADGFVKFVSEEKSKLSKRSEIERFNIDHNSILTVYFFPALLDSRMDSCKLLAQMILDKWNSEFKGYTLSLGDFHEIDAGFKRKLCYITTAVCESLGKSDDCYELKLLRNYRDTYLLNSDEGYEIVEQYYNVAPTIVNRINKNSDSSSIYAGIFEEYINPCIRFIEDDKKEECKELYSDMVNSLKCKYMES